MQYLELPNTDIKVSPVCLGTWQFNSDFQTKDKTWAPMPEDVSRDIVNRALEVGINFFDTAEAYPNSEEVLGRILAGRRKDVVIASKFGGRVPKFTAVDIEQSLTTTLQRLQTDYVDLYQVHWPSMCADFKEVFDELNRQQAKGRIRSYGVSNFGPNNLEEAISVGAKIVTNQVSYSLLWRPIEYEVLPTCRSHGVGILAYSPLQQGLLSGKYRKLEDVPEGRRRTRLFNSASTTLSVHGTEGAEKQLFQAIGNISDICGANELNMAETALSWLLHQEGVTGVIVGASSPDQVTRNAKRVTLQQVLP